MGIGSPLGKTLGIDIGAKLGTAQPEFAVVFNGTSTYIDCGVIGGVSSTYTKCIFSINNYSSSRTLCAINTTGLRIYVSFTGRIILGASTDTGYIISVDTEYVVETWSDGSGNIIRMDINGNTEWTGSASSAYTSDNILYLGARDNSGLGNFLNGEISYFEMSNFCVYKLNEGSGTVATDSSGNGNNGTIIDGTWVNL